MLLESNSIATKFQTRLQTGNNLVIQLGNFTKQIQKQYRIQTLSNLLSAAAITVVLLLFRYELQMMLIARETTNPIRINAKTDSIIMRNFARCDKGMVSVGLKAVAAVKAR